MPSTIVDGESRLELVRMHHLEPICSKQDFEASIEAQKSMQQVLLRPEKFHAGGEIVRSWVFIRQIDIMQVNKHTRMQSGKHF